ncbi:MAG: hypothetical protein P1P64_08315 [Treponemataceae bacterium]
MKTFIVNLKRSTERRAYMEKLMKNFPFKKLCYVFGVKFLCWHLWLCHWFKGCKKKNYNANDKVFTTTDNWKYYRHFAQMWLVQPSIVKSTDALFGSEINPKNSRCNGAFYE